MQVRQVRDIQYFLLPGAERQTTDIVLERTGEITVHPPTWMTPEQVDETVLSKRMWIYRNLAEWRDMNATRVVREFVSGESFLYLGRNYRLKLVQKQREPLEFINGIFCLSRPFVEKGGKRVAQQAFEEFYKRKGNCRIRKRVDFFAPRIGVAAGSVQIKELGFRWASISRKNNLNFHWKCMMAPATIIDYIVVHELCHIHHRDHTDAFWNEVDKILPDYRKRKDWLRVRGASMDL